MNSIFQHAPRAVAILVILAPSLASAENIAAKETTVPGGTLMLVAYMALWVMIFGYLAVLSRRQANLDDDIETLKKRLDDLFDE